MIKYRVKYTLEQGVFETVVQTVGSANAMRMVEKLFPDAKNISVVSQNSY